MSSAVPYQTMDRCSGPRRLAGFSLRGIAWAVLASWLFTFVVCSVGALGYDEASPHRSGSITPAHAYKNAKQDSGSPHADACCTVLENLSAFSQANNIQIPLHNLVYVFLPALAVLQAVLFIPAKTEFFGNGPPGIPNHVLIANSLWPNAPPR
ncbi:MAG: hypothetical protein ACYC9J_02280 [Sulfuricaulis sp.]